MPLRALLSSRCLVGCCSLNSIIWVSFGKHYFARKSAPNASKPLEEATGAFSFNDEAEDEDHWTSGDDWPFTELVAEWNPFVSMTGGMLLR